MFHYVCLVRLVGFYARLASKGDPIPCHWRTVFPLATNPKAYTVFVTLTQPMTTVGTIQGVEPPAAIALARVAVLPCNTFGGAAA